MLSEKILLALNDTDDRWLEETRNILQRYNERKTGRRLRVSARVILIAAVLAALFGVTAYALSSLHQQRQQALREELRIEENHVTGYMEFTEETASTDSNSGSGTDEVGKSAQSPSLQIISTMRNGQFVNVYFSIAPITAEEAWDAINTETLAVCAYGSNEEELDDAHLRAGDRTAETVYERIIVRPPIQEDEYLRAINSSSQELYDRYYDPDSQSLMLKTEFLLGDDTIDWGKPVCFTAKLITIESLMMDAGQSIEEYYANYHPVCLRDYGTVPVAIAEAASLAEDFSREEVLVQNATGDREIRVLGVRVYANQVEWQITHEDIDLLHHLPQSDDEAFRRGFEEQLAWLSFYDEVLNGSELLFDDGSRLPLTPSEAAPYENGVVTLYSRLSSTIDLGKVTGISIQGHEILIRNPFSNS